MSEDLAQKIKALKSNMPGADYKVGYCKPPAATRFTKGKSGNPKGRPRESKNQMPAMNEERLGEIIMQEAYRTIKVKDGAKEIQIPMAQAIVRTMAVNAARGDHRSQKAFTDMVSRKEAKDKKLYNEYLKTMIEYKIAWESEIDRHKAQGLIPPNPVPHPDHIQIDLPTGRVKITGPFTKEEKAEWDKLKKRKIDGLKAIKEFEAELKNAQDADYKKFLQQEISFEKRIIEEISRKIPE